MEARITRKTAALAIFLISAFQTYIYAGRPSSCQLLIINSYTENCLWSDDFMAPVYKEFASRTARLTYVPSTWN